MFCAFLIGALTLFDFATNAVAERVAVSDPNIALTRFVDYEANARKDRFVANTNFWLRGVDFSCASPWNSRGGRCRAGTAISSRHVVFAAHYPLSKGDRIVFVDAEGNVCPCRIAGVKCVDATDIAIGSLDYDLTPSIIPAKILPPDYEKHIGNGLNFPTITFNQREQALLTELNPIPTNATCRYYGSHTPADARHKLFRTKIVGGDSGGPAFLLIGNQPILLYCLHAAGCGFGPALHCYRREIQAAMDELCPGYKLEAFDFGGGW